MGQKCLADAAGKALWVSSMEKGHDAMESVDTAREKLLMVQQQGMSYKRVAFPWVAAGGRVGVVAASSSTPEHALLGVTVASDKTQVVWERTWDSEHLQYLQGHRVGKTALAPGTLYIEMARAAAAEAFALAENEAIILQRLQFPQMLVLEEPHMRVEADRVHRSVRVMSQGASEGSDWLTHAVMDVVASTEHRGLEHSLQLSEVQQRCRQHMDTDSFYSVIGNKYEGAFREVAEVWLGAEELLVRVAVPSDPAPQHTAPLAGASVMDCCCQAGVLLMRHEGRPFVFAELGKCTVMPEWCGRAIWAHQTSSAIQLYDEQLHLVMAMEEGRLVLLSPGQLETQQVCSHMYELEWKTSGFVEEKEVVVETAVLVWGGDVATELGLMGCSVAEDISALMDVGTVGKYAHVVHCAPASGMEHGHGVYEAELVLQLLQAVAAVPMDLRPTVWLVMQREQGSAVAQHPGVVGLVRAVRAEKSSSMRCVCIDVAADLRPDMVAGRVRMELHGNAVAAGAEDEVRAACTACVGRHRTR